MSGPSTKAIVGHHLTEAIRHLSAAAQIARGLHRKDAEELGKSLDRAVEAARDVRGDVEASDS